MAAARLLIVFALSLWLFSQETKAQGNGAVRLYNNGNTSPSNTIGIVEVYSTASSRWGTICSTGSDYGLVPDVVCHQLGYTGGNSDSSNVGTDPINGVLRNVSCSQSHYLVILQCFYLTTSSCDASENPVQVACYSSRMWDLPYTGMIRLQNGNYAGQGTVQVYCGGWGAICHDTTFNSDSDAVDTICKQLGYDSALSHSPVSNYNGRVLYENLNCPNVGDCLHDCASCPASDATCSANAVVNVTCTYTDYGGSYRYTCGVDGVSGWNLGLTTGIVIGAVLFVFICLAVIVSIPVCICCCLGIGIGAAAGSTRRSKVYTNMVE